MFWIYLQQNEIFILLRFFGKLRFFLSDSLSLSPYFWHWSNIFEGSLTLVRIFLATVPISITWRLCFLSIKSFIFPPPSLVSLPHRRRWFPLVRSLALEFSTTAAAKNLSILVKQFKIKIIMLSVAAVSGNYCLPYQFSPSSIFSLT